MTEHVDTQLKALDRLVGTWKVTGDAEGTVTYRWMEGGHFLIQDVDLAQDGGRVKGTEFIGRKRPFGAERPSEDVHSWYFDSQGATLAYVYEIVDDTLTIWAHQRDSGAYYRGTFNAEGTSVTGAWVYPGAAATTRT
ncbi:hypothetical protein SAMN05444920_107120 [Nonomuraea solani]|uniref:DUF1579 domain-containing protein n=1 Tax=Nonomuraea solani TaxID=1144553 RepID=A0A1H6DZW3_9ACTN|nr:hypothetical protein [Nonomuraea solani]SEG90827.1 hypothetical protein SAMN05444920_107120 [Nonomuraea solani]